MTSVARRKLAIVAACILAGALCAGAARAAEPADEIVGRWRGTSTCTKIPGNEACHDEQVRYDFARTAPDAVRLRAYKLVENEWGLMGELDFTRDARGAWTCEFESPRVHGLWSFRVDGSSLTGTLILLPGREIARNVAAKRE